MYSSFEERLDHYYPLMAEVELQSDSKLFQTELIAALYNQTSSLPTILNPIYRMRPESGFGVAVSVGGTNGYVSLFRITGKGIITFLNRKIFSLPEKTTKDRLFRLITENILKVIKNRKPSL